MITLFSLTSLSCAKRNPLTPIGRQLGTSALTYLHTWHLQYYFAISSVGDIVVVLAESPPLEQ